MWGRGESHYAREKKKNGKRRYRPSRQGIAPEPQGHKAGSRRKMREIGS